MEDEEDEMRLCLEGGLATTEVPLSWSPCVEDGGDQLQPPAMLSHTDRVYRYKVTPQVPCLQFTSSYCACIAAGGTYLAPGGGAMGGSAAAHGVACPEGASYAAAGGGML